MMKKSIYISVLIIVLCMVIGCDDTNENDVILPSEFFYISFEESELQVSESYEGAITAKFIYSGALLDKDLTINYNITFPSENAAAEEVDYILPANSGSFVLPAGKANVDVILIESLINDELSKGARMMTFELQSVDGLLLGLPSNKDARGVTVIIGEDDLFEFGYTSFEDIPSFNSLEKYPRPAASEDPMLNVQDSDPLSEIPYVAFVSTGNELGFGASFIEGSVTEIESEIMGVYNNTVLSENSSNFETNFIDGNQGYVTSDLDGTVVLTTDEIEGLNSDVINSVLEIKIFFRTTTWESSDGIEVYYKTEDGLGDPLISIFGDDIEALQGTWQEMIVPLPDNKLKTGRLVITLKNNQPSEMILLDAVSIKGIL